MTETRIRELFAEAADNITVGPPPVLADLVEARHPRRPRWATVAVGLTAAVAAGVVVAVSVVGDSPEGGPATSPDPSVRTTGRIPLDCGGSLNRTSSTWEDWLGRGPYRSTPLHLATLFTNPVASERAVVQSIRGNDATVVLLRGDGSAWARVHLRRDAGKGWTLSTTESCPRRFVRMYWQHQDHLSN